MATASTQNAISLERAREILYLTKSAYPAIILGVFLIGFIIYGVLAAPSDDSKVEIHPRKGPGGRPLPMRRKSASQVKEASKAKDFSPNAKLIFRLLTVLLLITFVVNGAAIILQVLIYREERWWPGQSAVVSSVRRRYFQKSNPLAGICCGFVLRLGNYINIAN